MRQNLLLEQTFRSYPSHCWTHNLCLNGVSSNARYGGVNTQQNVTQMGAGGRGLV